VEGLERDPGSLPPAIVFDLDGTLIDSLPDIAAAVNRMLVAEGLAPLGPAEVRGFVGDGLPTLVARVMAARSIPADRHGEIAQRVGTDYTARSSERTQVFPGVHAALTALADAGHSLGICTNKPLNATLAVIEALGLSAHFAVVIAGDSLPQRKPTPEPLLEAFRRLGRPGIFVGDSEVDAATAEAGAIPFVFFTEGYLRTDPAKLKMRARFSHFDALPGVVAALCSSTYSPIAMS